MNPDGDKNNFEDNSMDADKFHIAPEYGEQGEGPGEQPVRRVDSASGPAQAEPAQPIDSVRPVSRPRTIEITEVAETPAPASTPPQPRYGHGEEDVMQYFTEATESTEAVQSSMPRELENTSLSGFAEVATEQKRRSPVKTGATDAPANEVVPEFADRGNSDWHSKAETLTAGHSDDNEAASRPKKTNLMATIAIVLITIVVTAVAVFAILIITQDHSKDNVVTKTEETATVATTSSVTCTKENDEDTLKASSAITAKTTIIATYDNEDLADYNERTKYTYSDAAAAKDGLAAIRDAYTMLSNSLIGTTQDPFTSSYTQDSTSVSVSHYADASDLTFENMDILNIPKTNGTNPDIDAIKSALSDKGYTCKVKSAD